VDENQLFPIDDCLARASEQEHQYKSI